MIEKWYEKILGDDISLRERLFRIIVGMGTVSVAIAIIACTVMRENPLVILELFLGLIALSCALIASCKYHKMELSANIICILINFVLLPSSFFTSGGILSGSSVWFVFGIIFVFLLFTGRKFYIFLTLTLIEFVLTYAVAYNHPALIVPMDSIPSIYSDSAMAVVIVGVVIGGVIKFQIRVFTKEKELSEKRREEIEQISESKSTFFANMSHEIRTPINTIIGLNEMTLREEIPDEVAENAVQIQNASKMLLALINDILDLSKIESGKMEIVPVQYETGALFSDLVNIIWVKAQEKKLEFRVDIAHDLPSMLFGDEVRIKQILVNILTNAVKYTKEGSVTLSAKSERIDGNTVRLKISVEDTGIGIRKENMTDLFSSFKRVDQEKNRKVEGTGLGLSITKQLVDLMDGKIEVDSIYTKGSTFTVILDQQIINENPVGIMDFMLKGKVSQRERYKQSFEAPDARVLVVDDNEMNLMVAVKLLRATKVQIDTAASGMQALEMTQKKLYHVIFMDHKMPEMDGVETLRRIKQQENGFCQSVPVIALTANVMAGAEQIYREYGFQGYLAKPISGALFEAMLLRHLPQELVEDSIYQEMTEDSMEVLRVINGSQRKQVGITTDCVCDLPKEWMERFEIRNMYYYVVTSDGKFSDIDELSSENLLQYLEEENSFAHSEHAAIEEYEKFFADALEKSEHVIHISMAKNSSGGYEAAMAASQGFDHVTVIDSGQLSSGMGLMVLYAAQMAKNNQKVEDILEKMEQLRENISTSFIVPSAETLYRNGKIGKRANSICQAMQWRPILYLAQSKIKLHGIVTGQIEQAYRKYIRREMRHARHIDPRILFVTYAGCDLKQRQRIEEEIKKHMEFERIVFQKASATISSNCGLGTFGLIYLKK